MLGFSLRIVFEDVFFVFVRRIAGYLTSKNGKTDRIQTQREADKNNLLENLNDRLLNAIPNASRSTTQRKP